MLTKLKINYIVASYIGSKRNNIYYRERTVFDPLYFLKKHVEFIKQYPIFAKSVFVLNNDIKPDILAALNDLIADTPIELFLRENTGYSYGAWADVIEKTLDEDYDYYFLIEDDYIPVNESFIEPFVSKCTGDVCYVCSLAFKVSSKNNKLVSDQDGEFFHPSISNGLLSTRHVRSVYNKHKRVFKLVSGDDRDTGYINQLFFLKDYTDEGLIVTDITDTHSSPFMDSANSYVKIYGNPNNPAVLIPIK